MIRGLGLFGFLDTMRVIAAWCELRQDFRHFRTDRIVTAEFLDDRHGSRPGILRQRWKRYMDERHGSTRSPERTAQCGCD
jgi:predicted DNA-binding transcriptional regulator YafY